VGDDDDDDRDFKKRSRKTGWRKKKLRTIITRGPNNKGKKIMGYIQNDEEEDGSDSSNEDQINPLLVMECALLISSRHCHRDAGYYKQASDKLS